jgi:outer membrane biosynthesis protein TonB
MDVEAKRPPMSEVWTRLEGEVVNGEFPLRRYLGSSDHSGVFVTEYAAQNLSHAALKLVPAIPTLAESQLAHWSAAASVAHPHLIRLFETGRCQLAGLHYLYVIMDYAEQNLGQLLLHRALSENEVREMLPMMLEALGYLHSRDLVQGQLKPSNVLVIDNQLKVASDTIRPAGEATASIGTLSVYNPPEARDGSFSTSGDMWALGITLCQALTKRAPVRSGERGESVVLPTDFPVAFIDIVRRCLSRNPAQRPSVADFQEWLKKGPAEPVVVTPPAPQPAEVVAAKPPVNDGATRLVIRAVLNSEPLPEPEPQRKSWVLPIVIVVAVLGLGWAGVHWFMGQPDSGAASSDAGSTGAAATAAPADGSATAGADARSSGETAPGAGTGSGAASSGVPATSGAPEASSGSATRSGVAPAASPPSRGSTRAVASSDPAVLHEEIPNIPLHSRETIHGHVKVIVRVTVDKSGTVVSDVLENPGPSKYFARVAGQAASKWKFAPADHENTRQWLVRFEFSRDGTKANAVLRN